MVPHDVSRCEYMSEICRMCGSTVRLLRTRIGDGYICGGCVDRLSPNLYS